MMTRAKDISSDHFFNTKEQSLFVAPLLSPAVTAFRHTRRYVSVLALSFVNAPLCLLAYSLSYVHLALAALWCQAGNRLSERPC